MVNLDALGGPRRRGARVRATGHVYADGVEQGRWRSSRDGGGGGKKHPLSEKGRSRPETDDSIGESLEVTLASTSQNVFIATAK